MDSPLGVVNDHRGHPLTVWTNVPNPYNRHLYRSLRARGTNLDVVYTAEPQSRGRPWSIPLDANEAVAGTLRSELHGLPPPAISSLGMISGGYLGKSETTRRMLAPHCVSELWYWGERLRHRPLLTPYRRWYFRPFMGMFAIGTWARRSYEALARPSQTVHTLPYTTAVRTPNRTPSDSPIIGFAGSLIRRKGLDVLLRGLGELPASRRPALEVAGSGPLKPRLQRLGSELGLRVNWLGELAPATLDEHRGTWWAQAVPSRYDGWGVVVSEAMASGVPAIVSTGVGAGYDLVRTGFNGTIVNGATSWAEAVERHCDPAVVLEEGANARRVGSEMSSAKAAAWLSDVLWESDRHESRDFVAERWHEIRGDAAT